MPFGVENCSSNTIFAINASRTTIAGLFEPSPEGSMPSAGLLNEPTSGQNFNSAPESRGIQPFKSIYSDFGNSPCTFQRNSSDSRPYFAIVSSTKSRLTIGLSSPLNAKIVHLSLNLV